MGKRAKRLKLDLAAAPAEQRPRGLVIPDDEVVSLLPKPRLFWESPLLSRIEGALSIARANNVVGSDISAGLLVNGLGSSKRASLDSQASALSVSRWQFTSGLARSAAWAWLVDRWHRQGIAQAIARRARALNEDVQLVQACDHVSYDETPLELQAQSQRRELANASDAAGEGAEVATMTSRALALALLRGLASGFRAKTITKLFATKSRYCHLIKFSVAGEERYMYVLGNVVCQLQPLAKTSAACQALALMESGSASLAENAFEHKARLVDADGHRSNRAGERILDAKRPAGWVSIFCQCQAHSIVRAHNAAAHHVDAGVKGIIHLALCFKVAGSKHAFNNALWREVYRRLHVRVGSPSRDAVAYKQVVLRSFVSGDGQKTRRRVLFHLLPNSSMVEEGEITIWVDTLDGVNQNALKTSVADSMVEALMPRALRVLIRSKWGSSESAICDAGIIEMCHGLLAPTFKAWVRCLGRGSAKKLAVAAIGALRDGGAGADERMDEEGGYEGEEAESAGNANASSYAERLNQHMKIAGEFLSSTEPTPHSFFVLANNILRPLQTMLRKHCHMTSDGFEAKQRVNAAKRAKEGRIGINRLFPIAVMADGILERHCSEKLKCLLFNHLMWHLIRPAECNNFNTSLAFIMISDAGSVISREVTMANASFPTRLFKLLQQPELGKTMEDVPGCLKDRFTKELQASTRLGSVECLLRLAACAMLLQGNTVPNEVFNAQLRRVVKVRTQCPQVSAVDLSTATVGILFRARRKEAGLVGGEGHSDVSDPAGHPHENAGGKKHRGSPTRKLYTIGTRAQMGGVGFGGSGPAPSAFRGPLPERNGSLYFKFYIPYILYTRSRGTVWTPRRPTASPGARAYKYSGWREVLVAPGVLFYIRCWAAPT